MSQLPVSSPSVPTLYEWAGGMSALEKLTELFYDKVKQDPVVGPVFRFMPPDHPRHVAQFIAEVFKGPAQYSQANGRNAHAQMVSHHVGRHLTEVQRRQWIALLLQSADEVPLPDDPEFRSAFVAYLEWGTRLAVLNSQTEVNPITNEPMPTWGWGETGGPYQPSL